jgi:inorganic pyrophosphatase
VGAIVVDRFLYTTMGYPCNYGFIPHTLAEDRNAVEVMAMGRMPVLPGAVLRMRDEAARRQNPGGAPKQDPRL